MLVADKAQNRLRLWLVRLAIDEPRYAEQTAGSTGRE